VQSQPVAAEDLVDGLEPGLPAVTGDHGPLPDPQEIEALLALSAGEWAEPAGGRVITD
jgi:hypothetical protein